MIIKDMHYGYILKVILFILNKQTNKQTIESLKKLSMHNEETNEWMVDGLDYSTKE